MAETRVEGKPVVWLKAKYAKPKVNGTYKGGSSNTGKKSDGRWTGPTGKKVKQGTQSTGLERVKVVTGTGHVSWVTRVKEGKK